MIRVNNPSPGTNSDFHRICIDAKGISNKANPHIPVSPGTVKAAETMQSCLKVTGKALIVISLVATGIRIAKTIYDEVTIDDEIEALEQIVSGLEEDLADDLSGSKRTDTEDALDLARELLRKARHNKNNAGEKTLLTIVCIGGEYGGAAVGGLAGAKAGAMIGAFGGPVGAVAGAVVGSVIGAVVGSESGGSAVENFECNSDGVSTDLHGSLVSWGKDVQGEVLGINGNASVGCNGVELGAGAALFEMSEKDKGNLSLLKGGANFNVTNKGLDVGVESKLIRSEAENDRIKVGVGLNLDTGFKVGKDGVKVEALGFGFSCGDDGFGFKLPVFDFFLKN